jgi:hypothetical protein
MENLLPAAEVIAKQFSVGRFSPLSAFPTRFNLEDQLEPE